jgi:serine/threonine protein kinase
MPTQPNLYSPHRLSAGTRLNGIYEIDHQIGLGGMGEIYKGHVIQTGDAVAIKVMLPEFADNESALALFRKEASALHHLQHAAIVRYYVFTVEPVLQRPYLAMEFVDGRSLLELLKQGPLTFEAARSLIRRIAAGLQAAHEIGIIHRDVSPDNIIIPDNDVARAKIIDFGIARSLQLHEGTVIGSGFAGKHNYVSPEQLGLFGGNVTAKSDIYSLGLVMVQALTGAAIDMGGTQLDIVEKRRRVPDLGAIDMRFRPLLERMLQPDPDRRPQSMADVLAWPVGDPNAGRLHSSAPPRQPYKDEAAGQRKGRRRWMALATVLLIAAAAGGGSYYYLTTAELPAQRPRPDQLRPTPSESLLKPAPLPDSLADRPPAPTPAPGNAPAVQPARPAGRVDDIRRYVDGYNGGECFFVAPVALGENAAALEGFGASTGPFESLDQAFKRQFGFEASIGVRQVTPRQCAAISFLGRFRGEKAHSPRVQIGSTSLRSGETLDGSVENVGARRVELLLVSDGGTVLNVSHLLKDGIDGKTFSIGMRRTEGPAGLQPQLLVAIASTGAVDALRPARPSPADQVFPLAVTEASQKQITLQATARYFRLDK